MPVTVTDLGYGVAGPTGTCRLVLSQAVPAQGRIVVVFVRGAYGATGVSDSRFNTYTVHAGAIGYPGGGPLICSAAVTTALQIGDYIELSTGGFGPDGTASLWALHCPELASPGGAAMIEGTASSPDVLDLDYSLSRSLGAGTRDRLVVGAVGACNATFNDSTGTWPGPPSAPTTSISEMAWIASGPMSMYDAATVPGALVYERNAVVAGYQTAPPAAATWDITGLPNTDSHWGTSYTEEYRWRGETIVVFQAVAPPPVVDVSQARSSGAELLLVSHVNASGAVATSRYDTSLPPAVAATVTHESSLGAGVSLVALDGRKFELLYAHNNNVKRTITTDGGRTWAMATTIATGYQDVTHVIEESTGIAYAALWLESTNTWYLATGERSGGTGDHVYTVRGVLVTGAKRGASLIRAGGRRYEFAYRTTSDVLTIIRCKAASADSVGSWT